MTTMKLLTAAAIVTGLMASPVLAKDQTKHRAKAKAGYNMQMSDNGYRDNGHRSDMRRSDTGFWPTDVAAGAVGGAVGIAGAAVNTAGAIATAPFRSRDNNAPWDNSYASYDGPMDRYESRDSYARRNNFVCQPGTWIRGEDGQRHICQ